MVLDVTVWFSTYPLSYVTANVPDGFCPDDDNVIELGEYVADFGVFVNVNWRVAETVAYEPA